MQELNEQLAAAAPPLRDVANGNDWRLQARQPQLSEAIGESLKSRLFACKAPSARGSAPRAGRQCSAGPARLLEL